MGLVLSLYSQQFHNVSSVHLWSVTSLSSLVLVCLNPSDPTLTVENIGPIMEMVEDWRKVASNILNICIPYAIQERITQHHTTDKEQSRAAGEWWVHTHPSPSWNRLANALYNEGEYKAVDKMTQYLPKGAYMERGYWCYSKVFIGLVASVSLTENSLS